METRQYPTHDWTILALEWLAAVNFRTALISVGPVLPLIVAGAHISHAAGGLLFSLPILMLGLCAIPGGLLADRFGAHRVLVACLLGLAACGALRAAPGGVASLFVCTCGFGVAIGLAQPSLARLVKLHFPDRVGTATAVYSSGFLVGALLATGITVPWLVPLLGRWSWRGTFLIWAGLAGISALAWIIKRSPAHVRPATGAPLQVTLRNPLVWHVTGVFLCINIVFFTISSWLPSYYHSLGWSLSAASVPLTVVNLAGLVAGLLAPLASDRLRARRPTLLLGAIACALGAVGLLVAPLTLPFLWAALIGVANGAVFALCLTLAVDLASHDRVGAFTGLMLSFGNSAAVVGPLIAGLLRDVSGSYTLSLGFTVAVALAMVVGGFMLPESYAWSDDGPVAHEPQPVASVSLP